MTLEDFFTLTEIKDGLISPSRVEELVTVMQKDENHIVKNVCDASRQWAAVASTIAATKNKDCLEVFLRLDGLQCIGMWLKDAQKFSNESTDTTLEESIIALLRALENLSLDAQRSIPSGIWNAVKDLLDHGNVHIQGIAKTLFDAWKQDRSCDAVQNDISNFCYLNHDMSADMDLVEESTRQQTSVGESPPSKDSVNEKGDEVKVSDAENLSVVNSDKGETLQLQSCKTELQPNMKSDATEAQNKGPDGKLFSNPMYAVQEDASVEKTNCIASRESTPLVETWSSTHSREDGNDGQLHASKIDELSKDEMGVKKHSSSTSKSGPSTDFDSRSMRPAPLSPVADVSSAEEFKKEPDLQRNDNTSEVKLTNIETPVEDNRHGKHKGLKPSSSRLEDIEASKETKEDTRGLWNLSRFATQNRFLERTEPKATEMELEYGILDALEVATKVAQEVAREVADYREPSSSSSEGISGGAQQPGTPDSMSGKQEANEEILPMEVPIGENNNAETCGEGVRHDDSSDSRDQKPENVVNDTESSQVTEAAEEPRDKEKVLCDFDLNQEICSDGLEHEVNSTSTHIPVVSASHAAAASSLPILVSQFGASIARKTSTITSALCPPSRGSKKANDGLKEKSFIDIDLNVAEEVDDKNDELLSRKQIPVSSGLQSAESSLEVKSPRKSERLKWDLNTPPSESRMAGWLFSNLNGHRSPSPASSSSSAQPPRRNIDLNDGPGSHLDSLYQGHNPGRYSSTLNPNEGQRSGAPVISLMGTKVEVGKKEFFSQPPFLANGKAQKSRTDSHTARLDAALRLAPCVSCTYSPVYGYNGPTTAPGPSFSPTLYGPVGSIPYMVDSRGTPVVPHIVGSASTVSPMYPQSPFLMSMPGAPSGMNASAQSRPGLDRDSEFLMDGGNTDHMGFRQFLMPGNSRLFEEHLGTNSQPSSSSGFSGKRKEPEGGFEHNTFNYRHQPPPSR